MLCFLNKKGEERHKSVNIKLRKKFWFPHFYVCTKFVVVKLCETWKTSHVLCNSKNDQNSIVYNKINTFEKTESSIGTFQRSWPGMSVFKIGLTEEFSWQKYFYLSFLIYIFQFVLLTTYIMKIHVKS